MKTIAITDKEFKAAHTYYNRETGKEYPQGNKDSGGRWYPKGRDAEVMADVRAPSRSHPFSYYKAAKSIKHCAALFDADLEVVKAIIKKSDKKTWNEDSISKAVFDLMTESLEKNTAPATGKSNSVRL